VTTLLDSVAGRLPPTALPLIGRDDELADIEAALAVPDVRLLTLTGPPGVGKTRLAVAAARAVATRFSDGVVFVDLAPIRDPSLVLAEVARALGLRDPPGGSIIGLVGHALADKDLLLVIDNCEQVVNAAPDLAVLLGTCSGLRLLVTSRERLYLAAEREVPVQPLGLPRPDDTADPTRLAAVPAVAMLAARVRFIQPDFTITSSNAVAIAEICLRLDGLPLALELTAARAKLFSFGELARRLRHRMALLTSAARDAPDRHRTLRAALEWSYDLLAPDERGLFRRLSVFVGDWTLAAAEQVCADPGVDILDTVGSLVDKSLVQRTTRHDEVAEFVLLESLREYAAELLAGHDDFLLTRARHAAYFIELATAQEASIGLASESELWTGSTASDQANLELALEHCLEVRQIPEALRLAAALGWHSYLRGHLGAGRDHLDRVLAAAEAEPDLPRGEELAAALMIAGILRWAVGDVDGASAMLRAGLDITDANGDPRRTAIASSFLGHCARAAGSFDDAKARHEHAADLYRQMSSASGYAWTRYDLGLLASRQGDLAMAVECFGDGLMLFREIDYGWAIARCAWALAVVCLRRSEIDDAASLLIEALTRHDTVGDGRGLAQCMEATAGVAAARGRPDAAARLLGAAERHRERLAAPLPDEDREAHDLVAKAVNRALGPESAQRSRGAGKAMGAAEAVALARLVLDRQPDAEQAGEQFRSVAADPAPNPSEPADPPAAKRPANPLTGRERQVAELVAAGRTNRQIGRALGIAEKTVEVHVHHVIAKLGARSRTEVAAWVVTQQHAGKDGG
jgi:non-specific serine/threonine protein kinase